MKRQTKQWQTALQTKMFTYEHILQLSYFLNSVLFLGTTKINSELPVARRWRHQHRKRAQCTRVHRSCNVDSKLSLILGSSALESCKYLQYGDTITVIIMAQSLFYVCNQNIEHVWL